MTFIDQSHGWFVAADSNQGLVVEASTDGGVSWSPTAVPTVASSVDVFGAAVVFSDSSNGYLKVDGRSGSVPPSGSLYVTHDGAQSWKPASISDPVLELAMRAADDWVVTGCAADVSPCTYRLLVSTDRGDTWSQRSVVPAAAVLGKIVRDGESAWVYTSNTQQQIASLLYSSDDGAHWSMRPAPCVADTAVLGVIGIENLWLVCAFGAGMGNQTKAVYRSGDGGQRWQTLASNLDPSHSVGAIPFGGYVGPLAAVSDRQAWLGLNRGTVLRTTDAGATWQVVPDLPPPESFVSAVQFIDPQHGWVAVSVMPDSPDNGIYRTVDGGRTWQHVAVV